MKEKNRELQIKKLIEDGFALKLLSFELDIPLEELEMYKKQIEEEKAEELKTTKIRTRTAQSIIRERNEKAHQRLKAIKERYQALYLSSQESTQENARRDLTKQEMKKIKSKIMILESKVAKLQKDSKVEKRQIAKEILSGVEEIEQLPIELEEAEKLYTLLETEGLNNLHLNSKDNIDLLVNKTRRRIKKVFAESIYDRSTETDDVETLRELSKKFTRKLIADDPLTIGAYQTKIDSRITKMIQKSTLEKIRNDVPSEIRNVVLQLAEGNLDSEIANQAVEKEAKNRYESSPKTRFSLTEEKHKKQILIQIETLLEEKAQEYNIINPEATIGLVQELCGENLERAIHVVITNLINVRRLEEAKQVCDNYDRSKESEDSLAITLKYERNRIRNTELSDLVLRGIRETKTPEEENRFLELLEKGLKMNHVKMKDIDLGMNKKGDRKITLEDVWESSEREH